MIDIYDYVEYPTSEGFSEIYNKKKDLWESINIRNDSTRLNLFDTGKFELFFWLREFNNKAFDLVNSYVLLMNYNNKGIPDKEWFMSPGKNGRGIQYLPHFKEKHYAYLYWFGFYMDGFYSKYFSLYDTIYHAINVFYDLRIPKRIGFQTRLLNALKLKNENLSDFLKEIKGDPIYMKVSEFRNDLIHNFRPNQIDSGVSYKEENGKQVTSVSVGNYTTTEQFVENIDQSIELLASVISRVKQELSL